MTQQTAVPLPLRATIRERVERIETMPAIPAVFLPLLKLLGDPQAQMAVDVEEVARMVAYDNTIAAQCLRMAGSPLFGLAQPPKSIKGAVISLGLRRVETILLTCCLGEVLPATKWVLDPAVFWRHSLGCAMVCRKFSEKLAHSDHEKAYTAGLLHDLGFMVNCAAFPKEFAAAVEQACAEGVPLHEAEQAVMGFTHCESGRALAERWKLDDDIVEVIAHHHATEQAVNPTLFSGVGAAAGGSGLVQTVAQTAGAQGPAAAARPLTALVHLSDMLCRMRGLGYGYYERHKVDLVADPAWTALSQQHHDLEGVDLVRFTFELDEAVEEVQTLVAAVFGSAPARG